MCDRSFLSLSLDESLKPGLEQPKIVLFVARLNRLGPYHRLPPAQSNLSLVTTTSIPALFPARIKDDLLVFTHRHQRTARLMIPRVDLDILQRHVFFRVAPARISRWWSEPTLLLLALAFHVFHPCVEHCSKQDHRDGNGAVTVTKGKFK